MLDEHGLRFRELTAKKLIKNLEKRNMEGSYAPDAATALAEIMAMIPKGASVFRCGSMSMAEAGLWDRLIASPDHELINPFQPGLSKEEALAVRVRGLSADFMLASTNAITLDGQLVNLDGSGNRVAALTFGPKKVILLTGMNKLCPDLESAKQRVKHIAAPMNSIRLGLKTPCVETGLCSDCNSPQRICNVWTITERSLFPGRIHVKLVGEDLGY